MSKEILEEMIIMCIEQFPYRRKETELMKSSYALQVYHSRKNCIQMICILYELQVKESN